MRFLTFFNLFFTANTQSCPPKLIAFLQCIIAGVLLLVLRLTHTNNGLFEFVQPTYCPRLVLYSKEFAYMRPHDPRDIGSIASVLG